MAKSTSSFSELAQMYFPGCATPKNAVRCLQRSIKRCTKLATLLAETGYLPYNHRWLSPKQQMLIFENLGDHTVICRFFCTYISIISFIVLKRLLINYETIY